MKLGFMRCVKVDRFDYFLLKLSSMELSDLELD